MTSTPMTFADASWLGLDEPTNRMMITGVLFLDGPLPVDRLRDLVRRRLVGAYPGFARRIVPSSGWRRPRWQDDPGLDLDHHVRHVLLDPPDGDSRSLADPGGDARLRGLVARLMSESLDLRRPPWQLHLVDGLRHPRDGRPRSAVVARLHHSIADGIALAAVLLSLTDPAGPGRDPCPGDPARRDPASGRRTRPIRPPVRVAASTSVAAAASAARSLTGIVGTAVRLLLLPREPRTVLGGPLGIAKHAAWSVPRDLGVVKSAAGAAGATVNDVLLAATAGALHRHLGQHGDAARDLRVFVPADVRRGRPVDPHRLGNRFGLLPLLLPVAEPDPVRRLRAVVAATRRGKASSDAAATYVLIALLAVLPRWLHRIVLRVLGSKATVVVTNVPGPREPVQLAGTGLADVVFWVPQTASIGVGISIFSYAGTVRVGVAADAGVVHDPQALADLVDDELTVLTDRLRAAGPRA